MSWKPENIGDLSGQKAVVTGADSGIGFHLSEYLSNEGAEVVACCENLDESLRRQPDLKKNPDITRKRLNLADLESIETFASEITGEIDYLANNAGVMNIPWETTQFGFEKQFGVNFLGHFYLTQELHSLLHPESSVVTTTSLAHKRAKLDYESLNSQNSYEPWTAYADSKLACLLFSKELDSRAEYKSNAAHPGFSATNLFKRGPEKRGSAIKKSFSSAVVRILGQSAKKGSWPLAYALTDLPGAKMAGPSGILSMRGAPEPQESQTNGFSASKLWSYAEDHLDTSFL